MNPHLNIPIWKLKRLGDYYIKQAELIDIFEVTICNLYTFNWAAVSVIAETELNIEHPSLSHLFACNTP